MRFALIMLAVFVMISMLEEMDARQCPAKQYMKNNNCQVCDCDDAALQMDCADGTGQCHCPNYRTGRRCDKCASDHYLDDHYCTACKCDPDGAKSQTCTKANGCTCHVGHRGFKCDTCHPNYEKQSGKCVVRERSFKFNPWVKTNGPRGGKFWMHVTVQCDGYCIISGLRLVTSSSSRADVDMYSSERKWAKTTKGFVEFGWVFCEGESSSSTSETCLQGTKEYTGTLGEKSFHVLFISSNPFIGAAFKFKVANYKSVSNTDLRPYVFKDKTLQIDQNSDQGAPYNGFYTVAVISCDGYCEIKNIRLETDSSFRADVDVYGSDASWEQDPNKNLRFVTAGNEFCKGETSSDRTETCTATGKKPKKVYKIYVLLYSSKVFLNTELKFEAVNYRSTRLTYAPLV